jgi:hypothetical protein
LGPNSVLSPIHPQRHLIGVEVALSRFRLGAVGKRRGADFDANLNPSLGLGSERLKNDDLPSLGAQI